MKHISLTYIQLTLNFLFSIIDVKQSLTYYKETELNILILQYLTIKWMLHVCKYLSYAMSKQKWQAEDKSKCERNWGMVLVQCSLCHQQKHFFFQVWSQFHIIILCEKMA